MANMFAVFRAVGAALGRRNELLNTPGTSGPGHSDRARFLRSFGVADNQDAGRRCRRQGSDHCAAMRRGRTQRHIHLMPKWAP